MSGRRLALAASGWLRRSAPCPTLHSPAVAAVWQQLSGGLVQPERTFSSQPPANDAGQQQPGSRSRGGTRRPRGGAQPQPLFVPLNWDQQGQADLEHPLVQQMRERAGQGDAPAMLRLFEAALAPLEGTLRRGEPPGRGDVPPPLAWKLYLAALATTRAHAQRFSTIVDLMDSLGVPPQPACYVIALQRMALQGLGQAAWTMICHMQERGLSPTMRCYQYAIEACLSSARAPEFGFAKRLFDEVEAQGLAATPTQKADLGKLLMAAVREFARYRRFTPALAFLDRLEGLGLRVPAFLVADVAHMAALDERVDALLECLRRLERTTQTFQTAAGQTVTRPQKVDEGLLLGALEVAARQGHIELAEIAWQLLERSVALPNTPAVGHSAPSTQQPGLGQQEEGGAGSAAEGLGAAAAAELASASIAAADAAAASGEQAAADPAADSNGVRGPSAAAHLALIHAYAKAGQLAPMLEAVERLAQAYPGDPAAAAYHGGLLMAVDALAASPQRCDAAFHLLERWAQEGRPVGAAQANLVVAACCQRGDLQQAFATFDSFGALGLEPNADTYNALMQGCVKGGRVDTARKVHGQLQAGGLEPNAHTHHLQVDAGVVAGNVPAMMQALAALQAAGHTPKLALLERCLARAERAGDRGAAEQLLRLLLAQDYRVVGVEAKAKRWAAEGGMRMLTGSSQWFSREELLGPAKRSHAAARRGTWRQQRGEAAAAAAAAAEGG